MRKKKRWEKGEKYKIEKKGENKIGEKKKREVNEKEEEKVKKIQKWRGGKGTGKEKGKIRQERGGKE